jgi:acyl-CoA thioester hydrolase
METFIQPVQIRWSDLDPNFHLRHSVYYDWGALCRVEFLRKNGLTTEVMKQLHIGPIIFREECVFRREIRSDDPVFLTLELIKAKKDYSRWTIQHTIMKNKETVAAILTVDLAWLDTLKRKLAAPPQEAAHLFSQVALNENFQWID